MSIIAPHHCFAVDNDARRNIFSSHLRIRRLFLAERVNELCVRIGCDTKQIQSREEFNPGIAVHREDPLLIQFFIEHMCIAFSGEDNQLVELAGEKNTVSMFARRKLV
ncbi:MAG: hypothetical protein K1X64_09030 [Myxococcaceae bacterium]|nr:hypothetical protein [Myxococcaceae bacterium]